MTAMSTTTTKPRSDSASSRNDLFNTSWTTEVRPPRPLSLAPSSSPNASPRLLPSGSNTLPKLRKDRNDISEFGITSPAGDATVPSPQVSRTSSFFDKPTALPLPPRSVPPAPSPLNLSRSSSLRGRPAPLPLDIGNSNHITSNINKAGPSTHIRPAQPPSIDSEPLSPLHQSPSLPAIADWNPPRPPVSDDISLRLDPRSSFLLGEGRYATVYLASYKKDHKEKGRSKNPYLSYGPTPSAGIRQSSQEISPISPPGSGHEVNEEGDGFVGGQWKLCAAKRMAPDRQSQTMGLREAFFLNRLSATATTPSISLAPGPIGGKGGFRPGARQRAVSPLREGLSRRGSTSTETSTNRPDDNGSVYVVKLVAVKEDIPPRSTPAAGQGHGRSVSDAIQDGSRGLVRQRSSTMMNRYKNLKQDEHLQPINSLNSHPSLPSLTKAAQEIETTPALSRLVLILEHAPLGTMDRFLRTSPGLVGKKLWQRWAVQTTEALSWVHGKGIVHADIKAGNLLLTANLDVRISDFGSSLLIHPSHPPTDGVGLGTLPFSPPELVDPDSTFSFPVDIFSLGATLYQCITGREPYRGCRTIEMMHHVRKGGLWNYEERERLSRIGQERVESVAPSPYPSAWRHDYPAAGGVRRAGSLRVPNHHQSQKVVVVDRPKLGRMGSTESLRASEDVGHGDSPAAIRLWGKWIQNPHMGTDPISLLLADDISSPTSPTHASTFRSGLKIDISNPSPSGSSLASPIQDEVYVGREPTGGAYSDRTPAMFFLDGQERVDEEVWELLKVMLLPSKESRPTAEYLRNAWQQLGLRLGELGEE